MATFSCLACSSVRVMKRFSSSLRVGNRTHGGGLKIGEPRDFSRGGLFLAAVGIGAASCSFVFEKEEYLLHTTRTVGTTIRNLSTTMTTQMDYLEHDPKDYDIYIKNPTAEDLPYLLNQFDEHGKEVWPWIWTHPNETGPHFVFVGVNRDTLCRIRQLRSISPSYNILLIASEESIKKAVDEADDPRVYDETYCGIVSDASLELLNVEAKILMLSDERVIAFDSLTIA